MVTEKLAWVDDVVLVEVSYAVCYAEIVRQVFFLKFTQK